MLWCSLEGHARVLEYGIDEGDVPESLLGPIAAIAISPSGCFSLDSPHGESLAKTFFPGRQ
jgi:hypothetical protein